MCLIWKSKDLGPVDSYEQAVAAGFDGTHEEWIEMLAKPKEWAEKSESYAVGQKNGVDVESDDPAYQNNSKYYSEVAYAHAASAEAAKDAAETAAERDVSVWLEENISNPSNPPLDSNLAQMYAAAPAHLVGFMNDNIIYSLGEYEEDAVTGVQITNYKNILDFDDARGPAGTVVNDSSANAKVSDLIDLGEDAMAIRIWHNETSSDFTNAQVYLYDENEALIRYYPIQYARPRKIWLPEGTKYLRYKYRYYNSPAIPLYIVNGYTEGKVYEEIDEKTAVKADKVTGATAGNLAALDANGNLVDSGIPAAAIAALLNLGNNE